MDGWVDVVENRVKERTEHVSCLQIPKFIMSQVRQQNMENLRKQNKERAMRKLLKKITTDKPSDKTVPEVSIILWPEGRRSSAHDPSFHSRSVWLLYRSWTNGHLTDMLCVLIPSQASLLHLYPD